MSRNKKLILVLAAVLFAVHIGLMLAKAMGLAGSVTGVLNQLVFGLLLNSMMTSLCLVTILLLLSRPAEMVIIKQAEEGKATQKGEG